MEIIKQLSLNKNPQAVPNGSLLFAKNMKLAQEGSVLVTDDGFDKRFKYYVNNSFTDSCPGTLLGFCACNEEIVLFIKNDSKGYIYRCVPHTKAKDYKFYKSYLSVINSILAYDEDYFVCFKVNTNWKYKGSNKITASYTYNINGDLIVAIAECKDVDVDSNPSWLDDENNSTPLVTINLDKASTYDNASLYNVAPLIPIANLYRLGTISGNSMPTGIYQFFVRYEIDTDYYTKWQPIGTPQYAFNLRDKTIINHQYTYLDSSSKKQTASHPIVKLRINDVGDCPYNFSFRLKLSNTYNYKNIQIGYILQHDNDIVARAWHKYPVRDIIDFTFDASNFSEITIDDLLKLNFGLYNVKNIINYENRLYISDYIESNYNNVSYLEANYASNITCKQILKPVGPDVTISTQETNIVETKYDVYTFTFASTNNPRTLEVKVPAGTTKFAISDFPNFLTYLYESQGLGAGYATPIPTANELMIGKLTIGGAGNGDLEGGPYYLKDLYIGLSTYSGYMYNGNSLMLFTSGNTALPPCDVNGNYASDTSDYKNKSMYPYYASNSHGTYHTQYISRGAVTYTKTTRTERTSDTETTISGSAVPTINCLMPYQPYAFFVHYVRADGTYTNGIQLQNANGKKTTSYGGSSTVNVKNSNSNNTSAYALKDKSIIGDTPIYEADPYAVRNLAVNSEIDYGYYENSKGDKLFMPYGGCGTYDSKNVFLLPFPKFNNISIPPGFIGCFFSYAKVESTILAYVTCIDSDKRLFKASEIEAGLVNYNCLLYRKLYKATGDDVVFSSIESQLCYITNAQIAISNAPNIGGSSNSINTLGREGAIHLELNNGSSEVKPEVGDVAMIYIINHNVYKNSNKELVSFGPVITSGSTYGYGVNDGTQEYDYNYSHWLTRDNFLHYDTPVYIPDDNPTDVREVTNAGTISDKNTTKTSYAKQFITYKFSKYNLSGLTIKKSPEIAVGSFSDNSKHISTVVRPINASDLVTFSKQFLYEPQKTYTEATNNGKLLFKNTIRRSSVIRNENTYNAWREWDADDYFVLNKNKGDITNLVGIGNQFFIHTTQTLFTMNRDVMLKTEDKNIKLDSPDLFSVEPTEVFTGTHGYGGLQIKDAAVVNHYGYWFVDTDNARIYNYDGGKLNDISADLIEVLKSYILTNCIIGTDFENNRVFMCFSCTPKTNTIVTGEELVTNFNFTISFDLPSKHLISLHDFTADSFICTKNKIIVVDYTNSALYSIFNNIGDYKTLYIKQPIFPTYTHNGYYSSCIDIIMNQTYEMPKVLNAISYVLSKYKNYGNLKLNQGIITGIMSERLDNDKADVYDFGEEEEKYSGDRLLIYSDTCYSYTLNIKQESTNDVNSNYKLPYYDKNTWNLNYFRNYLNEVAINNKLLIYANIYLQANGLPTRSSFALVPNDVKHYARQKFSDMHSLIYGKYFVFRFIFDTFDRVMFENLICSFNRY